MNEQWWKFCAWNQEALYGFGTHDQAIKYCRHLNLKREINLYYLEDSDKRDDELCDYWPDIGDELNAIYADAYDQFISGFSDATDLDDPAEHWAAYSRQLPDSERFALELGGYEAGKKEGETYAQMEEVKHDAQ